MEETMSSFTAEERKVLHSLAETFQDKKDRDKLRKVVAEGATISEIILAYRTQKRLITFIKGAAGLIAVLGAAYAVVKGIWNSPGN